MSTITLITGTPRSGKSLYAVELLHSYILADELRPIFCDIKGINSNVVQPSPPDWRDVPDGSIIFYDECQMRDIFSAKFRGTSDIILHMTMHGHRGIDIVFITQGTRYMNTDIFPLVNRHVHVHNAFRSKRGSKLYIFDTVQTNLSKSNLRDAADVVSWRYPEHLYDTYESSSVHNKQSYVSNRVKNAAAILFGIVCMVVYYCFQLFFNNDNNLITNPESYQTSSKDIASVPQPSVVPAAPALASDLSRTVYDPASRVAMVVTFGDTCFAKNQFGEVLNNITQAQCFFYSDHPSLLSSARPSSDTPPPSPPSFPAPASALTPTSLALASSPSSAL